MKKEQRNLGLGLLKPISYQFRDDIDLTRLEDLDQFVKFNNPMFDNIIELLKSPITPESKQLKLEDFSSIMVEEQLKPSKSRIFSKQANEVLTAYKSNKRSEFKKVQNIKDILICLLFVLSKMYGSVNLSGDHSLSFNLKYAGQVVDQDNYIYKQRGDLDPKNYSKYAQSYFVLSQFITTEYFEQSSKEDSEGDLTIYFRGTDRLNDSTQSLTYIGHENQPMQVRPRPWTSLFNGGFMQNSSQAHTPIQHQHSIKLNKGQDVQNAVNKLNSVPFKVNTILQNYQLDNPVWLDFYKSTNKESSKQINVVIFLNTLFSQTSEPFYQPVFQDWRGRYYVNSTYITYQGNEQSRALQVLHDSQILTSEGLKYLQIHGANSYGQDNLIFVERIQWVKDNLSAIINLEPEFIKKAKSVIAFLGFAITQRRWVEEPDKPVNILVYQDATCSGLQHISSLQADEVLAKHVNALNRNDGSPGDVYSFVAERLSQHLANHPQLGDVVIDRSLVKKPVMTIPYGVTRWGIVKYLQDQAPIVKQIKLPEPISRGIGKKPQTYINSYGFKSKSTDYVFLKKEEVGMLAEELQKSLRSDFNSLLALEVYIESIVKLANKLNLGVLWYPPSKLTITQKYMKTVSEKITFYAHNKARKQVFRNPTDKINTVKQINSLMPNLIHSFDSSLVTSTILNLSFHCQTIHDCFGSHPNDMRVLRHEVIKTFVDMYLDNNYLERFHQANQEHWERCGWQILSKTRNPYVVVDGVKQLIPKVPKVNNSGYQKNLQNCQDDSYFIR